jgi:flap endonuclease-1
MQATLVLPARTVNLAYTVIMGVLLTPIVEKESPELEDLRGRPLAVDGNGELYQFLALIRTPDGVPLQHHDRITSHLVGLFYRVTRLLAEYGSTLIFVFDGKPPELKAAEIARRREVRARFASEAEAARAEGDLARAYSKSTMTSRLTREMVGEAREMLGLLGVPVVQAPGEGEAQAAFMAARGDAWAASSKDYDALLFGTPRLLRFLTIGGKEFLPSVGQFRPIKPELIDTASWLAHLKLTREQLIDLAILVGTDFHQGVHGIGPKKALKLLQTYGRLESLPEDIREKVGDFAIVEAVRQIYLAPDVTSDYEIRFGTPDERGLIAFLCDERGFSRTRVEAAIGRVQNQRSLF